MAHEDDLTDAAAEGPAPPMRQRRWARAALALLAALIAVLAVAWVSRETIADNVISGQLAKLGLPATYEIETIGTGEQVVRNLVIGDPKRPDFTVEEVRVATRLWWGVPGIGRITLVRPRLYGTLLQGKPSFGTLDKVLFTGSTEPFRMPDYDIAIVDGRALVESDYGPVAAKITGEGELRGGFAGELAAIAPRLAGKGCTIGRTSLYGKISTSAEKPRFVGPLRLDGFDCPDQALKLAKAGLQLDLTFDPQLDGAEGSAGIDAGALAMAGNRFGGAQGSARLTYRKQALTARYDMALRDIVSPQARLARLELGGQARSAQGFKRLDVETDVRGTGVALGSAIDTALADAVTAGEGTLLAPVAAQIREALARESRGSSLDASMLLRKTDKNVSLVIPRGSLRGGSGASLLALSRVQVLLGGDTPRISGNFTTGGQGLPRIAGRMEAQDDGAVSLRVHMPEFRARDARLALPQIALVQGADGGWGVAGSAAITGALPGGRAEGLILPIIGRIAPSGAYAFWQDCAEVRFDKLQFANLALDRHAVRVCPPGGSAIVQGGGGKALRIAAGMPSLAVTGRLGETPIRVASGPIGLAWPGALSARALDVQLGPRETASRFLIANLGARLGGEVAGTFQGSDISIYAVPLDLRDSAGNWRFAGGVLSLSDAAFRLEDREQEDRFQPLIAQGADLRLEDNVITAHAVMREPKGGREVVRTTILHDLATARGSADLLVENLVFDRSLQADELSHLALGIVSNLEGSVRGTGRIDWDEAGVRSNGKFSTDKLDFAAAFGPVAGLSGDVVFTDLLGLVTAPDQTLKIGTINPGIEVTDGLLTFELQPGRVLQVKGAQWPFMDGTLMLEPARMQLGVAETRRYTLMVRGLNAATFVQHLELANINATGVFDGELPLVFDENGGRVDGGSLVSRDPGGNLSYIGELTYKDLSTMGNFAFDALRSVDYKHMVIGMNGNLDGEILTRISFDGLSQGTGAKSNYLTKQVAKLPIRFILNIRAPFFSLFGSFRQLYDPSLITDPREVGLLDKDGQVRARPTLTLPAIAIQPSVSETRP